MGAESGDLHGWWRVSGSLFQFRLNLYLSFALVGEGGPNTAWPWQGREGKGRVAMEIGCRHPRWRTGSTLSPRDGRDLARSLRRLMTVLGAPPNFRADKLSSFSGWEAGLVSDLMCFFSEQPCARLFSGNAGGQRPKGKNG